MLAEVEDVRSAASAESRQAHSTTTELLQRCTPSDVVEANMGANRPISATRRYQNAPSVSILESLVLARYKVPYL